MARRGHKRVHARTAWVNCGTPDSSRVARAILQRVGERVYRIEDRFVNLYLVDAGRLVLVDTGTRKAEDLVCAGIRELGKEIEDIRLLLLTHHHLDHVGTAGVWKRVSNAQVAVHDADADVLAGRERRKGKGVGIRARILVTFAGIFARTLSVPPLEPDRRLGGNEVLDLQGLPTQVIHAPGHTLGSCAFDLPSEGVLFAGDAVTGRGGTAEPPWFVEDAEAATASFARLVAMHRPVLCPGHGDPIRRNPS